MLNNVIKAKKILLVDEDETHSRMLHVAAQAFSLRLDFITSIAALKSLEALNSYDLVVLDYDLGEKTNGHTGLEIAEILCQHLPEKDLMMLTPSHNPWEDAKTYLPNVKAVASKWDGIEGILETAQKLLAPGEE